MLIQNDATSERFLVRHGEKSIINSSNKSCPLWTPRFIDIQGIPIASQ